MIVFKKYKINLKTRFLFIHCGKFKEIKEITKPLNFKNTF